MSQKDKELGLRVRDHLIAKGLETPMVNNGLSDAEKRERIEAAMTEVMQTLGLDLEDDSLAETPRRIAKMYVNELFSGLNYDNFPKCTTVENKMAAAGEFVCVRNITVNSVCEHHFLPFFNMDGKGGAVIAYIPDKNVLGLSKLSRLVEFASSRPQIQERLCNQIMEMLKVVLDSDDVAVYIDTTHTCMSLRGVKDKTASTVTCSVGGKFLTDNNILREFLEIARESLIAK